MRIFEQIYTIAESEPQICTTAENGTHITTMTARESNPLSLYVLGTQEFERQVTSPIVYFYQIKIK